jgi:hypothetical protein
MIGTLRYRLLAPWVRARNRLLHQWRRLAFGLGFRYQHAGPERLTVILPSYGRPRNIDLILSSVVACDFVSEIIITNNNPEIRLEDHLHVADPRIRIIRQPRKTPASIRFDLSREAREPWILAIDDDVFPSPRQVRALFRHLLARPEQVHGYGGEAWGDPPTKANHRSVVRPRGTQPVDSLIWAFAYTRAHVEEYFRLLERLGIENLELKSSEDVPLSFAGQGPALVHDVGLFCRCPSESDPAVATWMRPGFFGQRMELVARCRELQASR